MDEKSLLKWAQRITHDCPDCGGNIPNSWVKMTAWCSKCERIWRVRRHEHTWKIIGWYHLMDSGKIIRRNK